MSAEMQALIDEVARGGDPQEIGQEMLRLITATAPAPIPDEKYADTMFDRQESGEDDYDNSFNSVTAAWIAGELSDEQYHALQDAVTAGAKPGKQATGDDTSAGKASAPKAPQGAPDKTDEKKTPPAEGK